MFWREKVLNAALPVAIAAQAISTIAIGTLGYAEKVPAAQVKPFLRPLVQAAQQRAYLIYPTFAVVMLVTSITIPLIIRYQRFWATIHAVLDEIQKHVFNDWPDLPEDEKRVTLFKHRSFCPCFRHWPWDWRNWMVAIERSGESTRSHVSIFRASLETPSEADGFAGRSWAQGLILFPSEPLPQITRSDTVELKKYAALSLMSVEACRRWLGRRNKLPEGLCGIPVELKNRRWGSLVLDASVAIPVDTAAQRRYRVFASIVGKLLE